jgi:DNA-binding MarR family transcriptional regulator
MDDSYTSRINELLVSIFQSVLDVEAQQLRDSDSNLSISEMHLLAAVAQGAKDGCTVSALAQALGVTLPTVTVAIKRLEAKEYVVKTRSETDGRMVRIALTKKGHRAEVSHRYFHRQLVRSLLSEVDEKDRPVLLQALENLNTFLCTQVETQGQAVALRNKKAGQA